MLFAESFTDQLAISTMKVRAKAKNMALYEPLLEPSHINLLVHECTRLEQVRQSISEKLSRLLIFNTLCWALITSAA